MRLATTEQALHFHFAVGVFSITLRKAREDLLGHTDSAVLRAARAQRAVWGRFTIRIDLLVVAGGGGRRRAA